MEGHTHVEHTEHTEHTGDAEILEEVDADLGYNSEEEEEDGNKLRAQVVCDFGEFECGDGSQCLMWSQRCDGYRQCSDGTDEKGCPKIRDEGELF